MARRPVGAAALAGFYRGLLTSLHNRILLLLAQVVKKLPRKAHHPGVLRVVTQAHLALPPSAEEVGVHTKARPLMQTLRVSLEALVAAEPRWITKVRRGEQVHPGKDLPVLPVLMVMAVFTSEAEAEALVL